MTPPPNPYFIFNPFQYFAKWNSLVSLVIFMKYGPQWSTTEFSNSRHCGNTGTRLYKAQSVSCNPLGFVVVVVVVVVVCERESSWLSVYNIQISFTENDLLLRREETSLIGRITALSYKLKKPTDMGPFIVHLMGANKATDVIKKCILCST